MVESLEFRGVQLTINRRGFYWRWQQAGGWVDGVRRFVPPEEKLFTWWSYRSPDWTVNNRGRRLDHIWASSDLAPASQARAFQIHQPTRGWDRPSDHVPVMVGLKL